MMFVCFFFMGAPKPFLMTSCNTATGHRCSCCAFSITSVNQSSATTKTSTRLQSMDILFYLFQRGNSKNIMYDINLDHVTAEVSNQVKWPTVPSVNDTFRTILGVRRSLTPLLSLLVVAACLYVAEAKKFVSWVSVTACDHCRFL